MTAFDLGWTAAESGETTDFMQASFSYAPFTRRQRQAWLEGFEAAGRELGLGAGVRELELDELPQPEPPGAFW